MTASRDDSPVFPFSIGLDLDLGAIRDPRREWVRRASDMRGYYADPAALERLIGEQGDPLHYRVAEVPVPESPGHLMYCISWLEAGRVGAECYMTKGHFHAQPDTAEIYLCLRGEGYLLLKTSSGGHAAEKMTRGAMVYVPPFWAHRTINTGTREPLVSFCVYPAQAGHDYGDIASHGFQRRVFDRAGQILFEETTSAK